MLKCVFQYQDKGVARPSIWSYKIRDFTRRKNTKFVMAGTSIPVVNKSTVTATFGNRSF